MEEKTYFGYYSWNGFIHSQKWTGDPPVGGCPFEIIQKHELEDTELGYDLASLAFIYPFKGLVMLQ